MDTSYDAIIIGAGHNGLILSLYLRRAGLSTLVLETAAEVGGFTRTEEPLLPGFRHNPHANFLSYIDVMPMIADFRLEEHGLKTVQPAAQHGICFSDGRPPVILHRPDGLDRSLSSIARYSKPDAATYSHLKRRIDGLSPQLREGMYAPARRSWFHQQLESLSIIAAELGFQKLGSRTPKLLIDDLFRSPEMRALLYQAAAEFGVNIEEVGGDISFLGLIVWMIGRWRLPVGGMQAVPMALARAAGVEGVHVATSARVSKIDVFNGRVRGVCVRDVGRIKARRVVASSAGLGATLLKLLGSSDLKPSEAEPIRAFVDTPTSTLASLMFCLKEPPRYKSARWDAEIDCCFHTLVGFDSPEEVLSHLRDVDAGALPSPASAVRVNTLWDHTQAPSGRHVAGSDVFMPNHRSLPEKDWQMVKLAYNDAFISRWAEFAPNMTPDNVLANLFELPGDYERKMYFKEGPEQYRTPIEGLYICGSSAYPGGGVHGAVGYNAYQVIAGDIGLPLPEDLGGPKNG